MTAIRKLAGNFVETDIDEEIVIMRLDNGELLSLADTAAARATASSTTASMGRRSAA